MYRSKYTLLIADDEAFTRENLAGLLDWKKLGITEVFTASDGIEAEELIDKRHPDIMLLDIRMPRLDGMELTERLMIRGVKIKIIVISAYSDFEIARRLISVGSVQAYILKPVDADMLTEAVIRCIKDIEDSSEYEFRYPDDIIESVPDTSEASVEAVFKRNSGMLVNSDRWIELVRQYIQDHISEHLTLSKLAAAFSVSPSYFSRVFSERQNCSFSDYVSAARIEKAKELLCKNHDMRIYEVAERAGFNSPQYFVTIFKERTGLTPADFRTKHYFDMKF